MLNKVLLIIRDGWGYREDEYLNAIFTANTPVNDVLIKKYPWTLLEASGEAVGLPKGYQGNSEVGHLTIGSGRVVDQNLKLINESIKDGSFFKKKEFLDAINNCKEKGSDLHIIGLLQKEGVHAHIDHLYALLDLCKREGIKNVYIHIITDGRDSPVNKSKEYLKELNEFGFGEVVTICGRYYAMDRDKRWERTEKAYQAIVKGVSNDVFIDPLEEIENCYQEGETDEFIIPRVKDGYQGIKDNDSVIFYNYRTDRPRQLTEMILKHPFHFVAMTKYYSSMKANFVFKESEKKNLLGDVLSKNGVKQLRVSETEKYAHVTYFFNGQKEKKLEGEDRIMIPSPKVSTYDKKPEMSVFEIKDRVIEEIKKRDYGFILVNLVNCDMVGHSGNMEAIVKAVEAVDKASGEIIDAAKDYCVFVLADHGNAEDQREGWRTSHTINPVPFVVNCKNSLLNGGGLKDIAPTILSVMGIDIPKEMTGKNLLIRPSEKYFTSHLE